MADWVCFGCRQQGRTSESASATSCSSSDAVVPVTAQVSSSATSDVIPCSSMAESDIHIVVDKQMPSDGIIKLNDGSIHIVVDDKTSSSRVVRTMVSSTRLLERMGINLFRVKCGPILTSVYCAWRQTFDYALRCDRLFSCIISACMLYYCDMVRWAWWDWGLSGWLTTLLQCFDTAGWVIRPVKYRLRNDWNCVDWDVKPCSVQHCAMN